MINNNRVYVLIHSPLVGPLTWRLVAEEIKGRGFDVLVPPLKDSPGSKDPFWKQHADSVSQALAHVPKDTSMTLVAHSGAGPLLPAIRQSIPNPVHSYVLVDAGIPRHGATRLDLMKSEDPEWAEQFQEELERGERFPTWSFDDLQEIIPDDSLRRQMVAELHPRGLPFFTESIPVFDSWPDAPCIYIQFSAPYERPAAQAHQAGWQTHDLDAGHFHMLVDPAAVTDLILEAANKTP
ncbi:MAG TPA: alpha/beta fold hydrolase [Anaerolineales bacterium]|nr:alpha/beta fold hydrolase [Anaerolineales bacterium]